MNSSLLIQHIMKPLPHVIIELANSHGGDKSVVKKSISLIKGLEYPNLGIKFQVFSADGIALPDFEWHKVYQKLEHKAETWRSFINESHSQGLAVWLDIFDCFGCEVYDKNKELLTGIKLQASVWDNSEVLSSLEASGISGKKLVINVSGHELDAIQNAVKKFTALEPKEIILQIGFQAYPTKLEDTALNKIQTLKGKFPCIPICLADHVSASDPMAGVIPLLGYISGCDMIEKHFCINRSKAPYDQLSAFEPSEMQNLLDRLKFTYSCFGSEFICKAEREYLEKTIQVPVAAKRLRSGSLISSSDLVYRRTLQTGISTKEIWTHQNDMKILDSEIAPNATISSTCFRKSNVAVIVAGRMKSTRLRKKAVLPIHGKPSIDRCLENCLRVQFCDRVILATSHLPEDEELERHTLDGRVNLWKGHPDDVIQRFLGACERFKIDVIVRVTADCPVVSPEIAEFLLKSHFDSGADYTAPREYSVGTNSEIYNTEALHRVIALLGKADHSEYMTWYMRNNPDVFKVNIVNLPDSLVRDYRLTLDYPEDLEMLNRLFAELLQRSQPATTRNIFKILDSNPELADLNRHLTLIYKTDPALIDKLNRVTKITTLKL